MIFLAHKNGSLNKPRNEPKYEQGVALISVILITAIITSMTVSLSSSQAFSIKKTSNLIEKNHITLTIEALEAKAKATLVADLKANQTDDAKELRQVAVVRVDDSDLAGVEFEGHAQIHNLDGLFNLSNLDNNFGSSALRGASVGGSATQTNSAQPGTAPDQPNGLDSAARSSTSGPNGQDFGDAPNQTATPRLCNDTLTCEWWQYAPQGFEQAPRANDESNTETVAANDSAGPPVSQAGEASQAVLPQALTTEVSQSEENLDTDTALAPNTNSTKTKLTPQEIAQKRLVNLFNALDIQTDLIPALLDWIDADTTTRYPNGAEDDYYMNLEKPYRTANRSLTSLREIMLIKGFDQNVYEKLKPHLVTLPGTTNINVNTASKEILMSLSPLIDIGTAEMLVSAREIQAFQSVEAFLEHPLVRGRFVDEDSLSVESEFFGLQMTISNQRLTMTALTQLHRFNQQVQPIRRTQGYLP